MLFEKMDIVIVAQNCGSNIHGMSIRPWQYARILAKNGHKVKVISLRYSHSRHTQPNKNIFKDNKTEAKVFYLGNFISNNFYKKTNRLFHDIIFFFLFFVYLIKGNFKKDTIFINSMPPYLVNLILIPYCKLRKFLIISDFRDIWFHILREDPKLISKFLSGISYKLEKLSIKYSDIVFSVFENDRFFKIYNLPKNFKKEHYYIPNGLTKLDISELNTEENRNNINYKNHNINNKFINLVYSGNIKKSSGIEILFKYLKERKSIILNIFSHFNIFDYYQDLPPNIVVHKPINRIGLIKELRKFDIGLVSGKKGIFTNSGLNATKYNDYFLAGLPVLDCSGSYSLPEPLRQGGGFIVRDTESIKEINKVFDELESTNQNKLNEIGYVNYKWILKQNKIENQYKKLLKKIEELLGVND